MNDPVVQILVAIMPSVVVFLTAFYLIKQMTGARAGERIAEMKKEDHKQVLPLRLQAYERIVLYLERIQPGAMVLRLHKPNMTARDLHIELVNAVREEYEHNVTQQVYMSDRAWDKVKQAREQTIRLLNMSLDQVGAGSGAMEMSGKVFENVAKLSQTPSQEAILAIKEEARRLF